ncbi:hypothetical protein JTB14_030019 [Gonioctena quinquepunctata]|nr:hypothetical protein JTB14_030019 [Gonioctena quinquepunctata]
MKTTSISEINVNRQNCRYWATKNPRWMMEYHTQNPHKVNVWCGIVDGKILGPYFFELNLTGAIYLDSLRFDLIPALIALYADLEEPDLPKTALFLKQDDASPHYAVAVRNYLDVVLPNPWTGKRDQLSGRLDFQI